MKVLLLALPIESELFMVVLNNKDGEKSICQLSSYTSGSRGCVNILKQRNHIWYSSYNRSYDLVKLMIIQWHSSRPICLLQGQLGKLNGDRVEIPAPAYFS